MRQQLRFARTAFLPFHHVPFSLPSTRSLAYRRRLHIKNLYRLLRFVFMLLFRRLPLLLFRLFGCLFLLFLCIWHAFDLENVALGAWVWETCHMPPSKWTWAIPIAIARLALPNGAQQPRRRLESVAAPVAVPSTKLRHPHPHPLTHPHLHLHGNRHRNLRRRLPPTSCFAALAPWQQFHLISLAMMHKW